MTGGLLMNQDDDRFEVLPRGELQKKYGLYAENRPDIKLDPARVPANLRHLIPLAEKWGVADDIIRDDMIDKASKEDIAELKRLVEEYEDLLDDWLAGPEAKGPKYSDEYIAFSAMQMAALCA